MCTGAGTYRNLKSPALLFEMELDEALKLLATKPGREVLKEMGPHPETGVELEGPRMAATAPTSPMGS